MEFRGIGSGLFKTAYTKEEANRMGNYGAAGAGIGALAGGALGTLGLMHLGSVAPAAGKLPGLGGVVGAGAGAGIGALVGHAKNKKLRMQKTALIQGASVPDHIYANHPGVTNESRERAYTQYLQDKSSEPPTSLSKALWTGGGIGFGVGALVGMGTGSIGGMLGLGALGAAGGALLGHAARAGDMEVIKDSKELLEKSKTDPHLIPDLVSKKIGDAHQMEEDHKEFLAAARHQEMMNELRRR